MAFGQSASGPAVSARAITATVLGNGLEFFDFTVYAFFAVMIGRTFFPGQSDFAKLLLSVATFGAGFITRPLGSLLIGALGDRAGRRPAMTLTMALMAVGSGLLALTPSYARIGIAAPVLVLLARLIQGFSLGGEVGPATTYLVEIAGPGQRGLIASWQRASQGLAIIAGSLFGFVLSLLLNAEELANWGWRLPFLVGAVVIAPVGVYVRSQLHETIERSQALASTGAVISTVLRRHWPLILLGTFAITGGTVTVYINSYVTTYALTALRMSARDALLVPVIGATLSVLASLLGGWLSDRAGRKAVMIVPLLLFVAIVYPAYRYITETRTLAALLWMTPLLWGVPSLSSAALVVWIPECFPMPVRSVGLSVVYATGVSLFGGTTQFMVTWLIGVTGDPMSPAWYLIGANLISLAAMLLIRPPEGALDTGGIGPKA